MRKNLRKTNRLMLCFFTLCCFVIPQSSFGESKIVEQYKDSAKSIGPMLDTTSDATIHGIIVGRGGGSVLGNHVFGLGSMELNSTGSAIAAFGSYALQRNTTGNDNSAFGFASLSGNKTANSNSAFGSYSAYNLVGGGNNTAVGYSALFSSVSGTVNTAVGAYSLRYSTGHGNTAIGYQAGGGMTTGDNNTIIGAYTTVPSGTNNNIVIADGSGNQRINVDSSGHIGLGSLNSSYQLTVNGDSIGTSWNIASDRRLKTNIANIERPLEKVLQLRGITFDWRAGETPLKVSQTHDIGLIAQEVEKIFPEIVTTDSKGLKSVSYSKLVAPLIEAIKELHEQNEVLRKSNANLQQDFEKMKRDIELLRK